MTFKRVAAKSNAGTAVTQHSSGNVIEVALDDDVLGMTKHQALGNVSGTISWDAQAGNCASLTATGNLTFTGITNVQPGTYMLKIVQDATGGRTLTLVAPASRREVLRLHSLQPPPLVISYLSFMMELLIMSQPA